MARIWNKHKQTNTPLKRKILVAMSGGVDSSVAVALLVKAGYEVTGVFMINYDEARGTEKCWSNDYCDAVRVAAHLGIALIKLDFTKEYKKFVLDYMYREYEAGRTPNPDVLCNKFVKFGAWLEKARELGFDKLATGHYARLGREFPNPNFQFPIKPQFPISNIQLFFSKDTDKDQTYFLHQLTQNQLCNVLFPIGDYLKSEVRSLARKFGLPTAEKEESMGICFIGEVPMKEFLMKKIKPRPGDIVMSGVGANGRSPVLGRHDGLAFYTIGQRYGLSLRGAERRSNPVVIDREPFYVVAKDFHTNTLIVGHDNDPLLYKKEIEVMDINWIAGRAPKFPLQCEVRLRHRQPLQKSKVISLKSKIIVIFDESQRAVTPGQFAVFYMPRRSLAKGRAKAGQAGECLGGGVIN